MPPRLIKGNILGMDGVMVIPINLTLKTNGDLVMGAGLALKAAEYEPCLPYEWGRQVQERKMPCYTRTEKGDFLGVPTKRHWKDRSTEDLIRRSVLMITRAAEKNSDVMFYVPLLGAGLGGLNKDWVIDTLIEEFEDYENITLVDF